MPSTPVAIGPFTGGLNNYSDPSAVGDNECVQISNFDVDLDGTLVSRPPITIAGSLAASNTFGRILSVYTEQTTGVTYIIYAIGTATRVYNTSTNTSVQLTGTPMAAAVMYSDMLWLVSEAGTGGKWSPSSIFETVADIPNGTTAVVYKERMFVGTPGGRVHFSNPGNFESWGSSNFLDVRPGDGQVLVKLMEFSGQIVIFKTESTFIFQYDSSPTRGAVQNISSSVGADNAECIAEQDGVIYVYHNQSVYSINNWNWEQINIKLVLQDDFASFPVGGRSRYSLSILGYRLVVRFGTKLYTYGLKTKTWSMWTTSRAPDFWVKHPEKNTNGLDQYYAAAYSGNNMYLFLEEYGSATENFTCSVTSKMYDYSVPYSFKRLFWWGIDIVANNPVTVVARPHVHTVGVTWDELKNQGLTWATLTSEGRTWSRPQDKSLDVSDYADINYATGARVFVRFIKALRFRKISFYLESNVDGSAASGPLRIFSMVSNISNRQLVPKKLN